jgi:hypothetical protein
LLDGGPGAVPEAPVHAWLVSDPESELRAVIRRLATDLGIEAGVGSFAHADLSIESRPVVHTNHPTYGYLIRAGHARVVWAPEFLVFPEWAAGADLMFAEAAAWNRPIRFPRDAGGHAPVLEVGEQARQAGVRRLVYAHIGRPTIRAIDAGRLPLFGQFGVEGRTYIVRLTAGGDVSP